MKGMLFCLSLLLLLVATSVFIPVGYAETAELPVDLTLDGKWLLTTDAARFGLTLSNTLSGERIPVAHTRGAGYYASFSPDGDYVCYKEIQIDDSGQIKCTPALFSLASRQMIRLAEPARLAGTPAVSQDGRIAYTTDEDLVICLADFNPVMRLSLGYHVNLMAFSPDGSSLVFPDANQQMIELVLEGQETRQLFSDPKNDFWGAQFSPRGGYLLFQSVGGKIFTYELETESTYLLGEGCNPAWIEEGKVGFVRKSSDGRKVTSTQLLVWEAKGKSLQSFSLFKGDVEVRFKGAYAAVFQTSGSALHRIVREKAKYTLQSPGLRLGEREESRRNGGVDLYQDEAILIRSAPVILSGVETIHQVYDTPNWFNGHWACGATSASMALSYYNLLPHWDTTVSIPYSHVSHFGRYICETYTYNGFTFDIPGDDPSGTPATGGYGYIIQNNWENTKGHMAEYISYHGPASSVDWSPSITKARNEIDDGHPFVVLNSLTSAGHYITCVGYPPDQYTLIFNDPYGNKNTAGYPSYDGTEVSYDWPGYNNGYQNLNTVWCYIYARMDPSARFSNAIRNGGFEQDFEYWTKGSNTNYEILTSGVHGGSKACRFYRGDGYATIWQNPGERNGELWRATCYAYAFPETVGPEFGFKDQAGNTEASVSIDQSFWEFYSVEWTIGDDIDVQAWGNNSSLGVVIDDVRAGKASRMNWVTDWCCCGPFPASLQTDHFAAHGGEASLLPSPGLSLGGHLWEAFSKPDGFMDLNDYLGTSHGPCAAYAHVYVECAQAIDNVYLIVGADDGIQVLLNGEVVYVNDADSAQDYFNPDEDVIEGLHLNAGENRLMIKVRDAGEAFSFSARFCDEKGEALPGLSYYLSSQQEVPSKGLWQLY